MTFHKTTILVDNSSNKQYIN